MPGCHTVPIKTSLSCRAQPPTGKHAQRKEGGGCTERPTATELHKEEEQAEDSPQGGVYHAPSARGCGFGSAGAGGDFFPR